MNDTSFASSLEDLERRVLARAFLQDAPIDFARGVSEALVAVRTLLAQAEATPAGARTGMRRSA